MSEGIGGNSPMPFSSFSGGSDFGFGILPLPPQLLRTGSHVTGDDSGTDAIGIASVKGVSTATGDPEQPIETTNKINGVLMK